MTLVILNTSLLREADTGDANTLVASVTMTPSHGKYLTAVHVDLADARVCLYSESQNTPRIPDELILAVDTFNADPTSEWRRLVSEALDAEEEILAEDRADLDERATELRNTRQRLLGTPT